MFEMMRPLDSTRAAPAERVAGSLQGDDILTRHPVVSSAVHERHDLLAVSYLCVGCDCDITQRASWRASLSDESPLVVEHRNPTSPAPAMGAHPSRTDIDYLIGSTQGAALQNTNPIEDGPVGRQGSDRMQAQLRTCCEQEKTSLPGGSR